MHFRSAFLSSPPSGTSALAQPPVWRISQTLQKYLRKGGNKRGEGAGGTHDNRAKFNS